ncbi:hypothetical protein D3C71_1927710 [compost metagenome]
MADPVIRVGHEPDACLLQVFDQFLAERSVEHLIGVRMRLEHVRHAEDVEGPIDAGNAALMHDTEFDGAEAQAFHDLR